MSAIIQHPMGADASPFSILMYSHDGFGLGHLKRNFTIAKKLVATYPNCNALLLMGHTNVPFHPIPKGIDFLKLPSIIKINDEVWQPRTLPMEPERFKNFRSSLIRHVAEHYQPDLFLVDYVPKGVWGELLPTLHYLKYSAKHTKIILGLRDIIDEPEQTKSRWQKGNTYEVIREFYDQILIYGSEEIYRTAEHYGLIGDLAEKVKYCGYLCKGEPDKSPEQIRKELGVKKDHLVVVTAGGGGDAYPMMKLCMEALQLLGNQSSIEALFITGPLMKPESITSLENLAENIPAKVLTSSSGIINYMNAANLLITMGSYNTMMEAVKLRRPTIVIPREGPSAEQKIRTKLFAEKGFVESLPSTSELGKSELALKIMNSLLIKPSEAPLNMNGLNEAVNTLSRYFANHLSYPQNTQELTQTAQKMEIFI